MSKIIKNIFFATPELRFIYEQIIDDKKIKIDTDEINEAVDGLDMQNKETRAAIKEYIETHKTVANC
jgi:FKBP-type peptidyl-prolyl cis-trans isomerase (trigger factor)